jgi:hypothetical protein
MELGGGTLGAKRVDDLAQNGTGGGRGFSWCPLYRSGRRGEGLGRESGDQRSGLLMVLIQLENREGAEMFGH